MSDKSFLFEVETCVDASPMTVVGTFCEIAHRTDCLTIWSGADVVARFHKDHWRSVIKKEIEAAT